MAWPYPASSTAHLMRPTFQRSRAALRINVRKKLRRVGCEAPSRSSRMTTSGDLNAISFNSSDPGELQEGGVRGLADVDAVAFAVHPGGPAPAAGQAAVGFAAKSGNDNLQAFGESAAGRSIGRDGDEELASAWRSASGSGKWAGHDAWIGAGEAGGENFDHQRGADPFVAAGRRHRPRQCGGGIGGRLSLSERPSFWNRFAGACAFHDFALGDDAGAFVDDEARRAAAVGNGERPGIGAERRLAGAPGRDRGGRIGEAERDKARLRQLLRVIAQDAAIIGIAD